MGLYVISFLLTYARNHMCMIDVLVVIDCECAGLPEAKCVVQQWGWVSRPEVSLSHPSYHATCVHVYGILLLISMVK